MPCRFVIGNETGLCQNRVDYFSEVTLEGFATWVFEAVRVQAQLMKDRGVNVGYVMTIFRRVETEFVRRAMIGTWRYCFRLFFFLRELFLFELLLVRDAVRGTVVDR